MTHKRSRPAPVSLPALMERLGVGRRTVVRWLREGLPSTRRAGRGRPHCFSLPRVEAWLIARGLDPSRPGRAPVAVPETTTAGAVDELPTAEEILLGGALGYDAMLARLHHAEREAFGRWTACAACGDPGGAASFARIWNTYVEALRKVAKDQAAVRAHKDAFVPKADAIAALERLATEIRMAFVAIPRSLAPRLVGLTPAEIERIIEGEVRACLELLSAAGAAEETTTAGAPRRRTRKGRP